ncbi:phosphate-starvation-inducible protein PsiE [uncultured Cocleimonas sp.]|uniref:phosphate-starvation-inducible protein PsiE n=1 Tax=uncultured Cocleimonas sp. TaxID=1051587 RepID=UPI002609A0CB|nr:phosphate-starvation-inducible PsiE family protein [uncultured Cocleimonas sp.]
MDTNKQVHSFLHFVEQVGLFIILIATIIAVGQEVMVMIDKMKVELKDLLLLFIYLEIIAMVQIYYEEHRLPIRYPIYIAIVALARFIILDSKSFEMWHLLEIGLTILILTIAVYVVRYGHVNLPYSSSKSDDKKKNE